MVFEVLSSGERPYFLCGIYIEKNKVYEHVEGMWNRAKTHT